MRYYGPLIALMPFVGVSIGAFLSDDALVPPLGLIVVGVCVGMAFLGGVLFQANRETDPEEAYRIVVQQSARSPRD